MGEEKGRRVDEEEGNGMRRRGEEGVSSSISRSRRVEV